MRAQGKSTSWERVGRKRSAEKNRREGRGRRRGGRTRTEERGVGRRKEERGGERRALQPVGSPWSPVPGQHGVLQPSELGLGTQRTRRRRGRQREWRSPTRACFITLDSAQKLLGWSPSRVGEGQTGAQKQTLLGGLRHLGAQGEGGGQGLGEGSRRWPQELRVWVPETVPILAAGSREASCLETVTEGGRGGMLPATSTSTSPPKVKGSQGAERK